MYVLDTNVVSELRKGKSGGSDASVRNWIDAVRPESLFVSVITIMEIEIGMLRIARRDAPQGKVLRRWLFEQVLPGFANRILPIDLAVARRCAGLHVPDPRHERDALIAATALTHGMAVVTRNTADFAFTGVKLIDPFKASRD